MALDWENITVQMSMGLHFLKSIGLCSIVLAISVSTIPASAQIEPQIATESQIDRTDDGSFGSRARDGSGSTLRWLALLPLFGGASFGFILHRFEKRAQNYLDQLNILEDGALSQTRALTTEANIAIGEVRAYLDRPFQEIETSRQPDERDDVTFPLGREQLHPNPTNSPGKSLNLTPASFDGDGERTAADTHENPPSPGEGTTGRTYLDLDDGTAPPQDNRAREYCRQGNHLFLEARYAEAISAYDRAIQLCPNYHQAWCNRGSAFFQLAQYERAIADTDRALAIQPNYGEAWNNRGAALAKLKRVPEALISYNKALQLQPKYPDAWINRGLVLMELGQYGEALFAYTKAAEYQSGDRQIWFYRAQALTALEQYSRAIEACDRALELQPQQPKFFYHKATCYALQGNIDLALKNLQQAILLGSDSGFKFENYRGRAQAEPAFASLCHDPRFQELVGHP